MALTLDFYLPIIPPFPRELPKAIPGEMGARLGESSYVNRLSESLATEGCDCNHMSSDSVKLKFLMPVWLAVQ